MNKAGLGPTKLMSPARILHNCGSSSRLLLRKKLPIGVKCSSGLTSKCVGMAGVPTRMLRNLGILKILLYLPMRLDQYRAGPGDVRRMSKAIAKMGRTKIKTRISANTRSNTRFKKLSKKYCTMLIGSIGAYCSCSYLRTIFLHPLESRVVTFCGMKVNSSYRR